MRKKSEVPELNQAKLGLVKLRQSCWLNFNIVVKSVQLTNLFLRTVSAAEIWQTGCCGSKGDKLQIDIS